MKKIIATSYRMIALGFRNLSLSISDVVVFPLFFLIIHFRVEPVLLYHSPMYHEFVSMEVGVPWYLSGLPAYAGKLMELAASALLRLFHSAYMGAVIITLIAAVMSLLTRAVIHALNGKKLRGLEYVPAAVMIIQCAQMLHSLSDSLSVIAALVFLLLYFKIATHTFYRTILFFIFSAFLYWSAKGAFIVFLLPALFYDFTVKKNSISVLVRGIMASAVPGICIAILFPIYSFKYGYMELLHIVFPEEYGYVDILQNVLYIFLPLLILLIPLIDRALKLPAFKHCVPARLKVMKESVRRIYCGIALGLLIAAITGTTVIIKRRCYSRHYSTIAKAMNDGNWKMLIDEAAAMKGNYDPSYSAHLPAVNYALYRRGSLLESFLAFPQNKYSLFIYPEDPIGSFNKFWNLVFSERIFYDMGLINLAEHCAYEISARVYHPPSLQILADIYTVKRMPEAARVCLRILRKDRLYADRAKFRLAALESDPHASSDRRILRMRNNILKRERLLSVDWKPGPVDLVEENKWNHMAFEYMIASFLIERNLKGLAESVSRLREMKYTSIPRLYEEALIIYGMTIKKEPPLGGYNLSPETSVVFGRIRRILNKYKGNARLAYKEIAHLCPDSYFYYFLYGSKK